MVRQNPRAGSVSEKLAFRNVALRTIYRIAALSPT
jgi:hypothetical protein